ncbi:intradiol ring-cleavage dioxygenase [Streptomyces sp. WI04-05B]|uniref:intradiol ring-cleavage dioxygenase n=1 Tax=Streptomyces TaxID=1883 RepID=UPI0029B8CCFB|nr:MULTISPECIES: intradiol ring-cleavage dioxygenase [unclassified Streptomyces]MDX2548404.1 intradiol ring-cleavage dioxygenase [Streptomyces sp. WI04-05B]MDX2590340.1 intradiol ring-cleavage dioxygenase [Streptomyces sp. WI04-05A]
MTETPKEEFTRRRVVVAGGATAVTATAVALGAGLASAQGTPEGKGAPGGLSGTPSSTPSGTPSGTPEACYLLTTETTEGPYYIDADKLRQDVTEDEEGIPLTLRLKVIDAETCRPVRNAAVDIWHCSALGIYSGYEDMGNGGGGGGGDTPPSGAPTDIPTGPPPSGGPGGPGGHQEPTDDERYLRGTWRTDRHGQVTFRTVFPGWYRGRCVHIHVKVHVDGTWTDAGYEGGHTCHTGQLFFDEESVLLSAEVAPYSTNTATRTTLDEDTIYPDNGAEGGLLRLRYRKRDIGRGVLAELTMGVAPDETHDSN